MERSGGGGGHSLLSVCVGVWVCEFLEGKGNGELEEEEAKRDQKAAKW